MWTFGDEFHLQHIGGNKSALRTGDRRPLDRTSIGARFADVLTVADQVIDQNVQSVRTNDLNTIATIRPEHAKPPFRRPHFQAANVFGGGQDKVLLINIHTYLGPARSLPGS